MKPPKKPSIVLFGETLSINLCLPKFFPIKNAKTSLLQINIKIPMMIEVSKVPSKFKYGILINNEKGMAIYIKVKKFLPKYCLPIFLEETSARINEKYMVARKIDKISFSEKSSSKTTRLLFEITAVKKQVAPSR